RPRMPSLQGGPQLVAKLPNNPLPHRPRIDATEPFGLELRDLVRLVRTALGEAALAGFFLKCVNRALSLLLFALESGRFSQCKCDGYDGRDDHRRDDHGRCNDSATPP